MKYETRYEFFAQTKSLGSWSKNCIDDANSLSLTCYFCVYCLDLQQNTLFLDDADH